GAARRSSKRASASGPRWPSVAPIRDSRSAPTGAPSKESTPAIPHIARRPALPARFRPRLRRRRAVPAVAEDLVPVAVDHEADVGRDLVLDALDLGAGELEDLAA